MFTQVVAAVCVGWYVFIALVCTIGYVFLFRHYRRAPRPAAVLSKAAHDIPHVTIIRPCKGLEPDLYRCLRSTFLQTYPRDKLTIHFCISSATDPAIPIIRSLLSQYPRHDARLFVEDDRPYGEDLGPNPKIRNMSRAYGEAKGDLVWIIDCNVWVGRGVCGRMVDKLCGYTAGGTKRPYKLVHQLPVSVDVEECGRRGGPGSCSGGSIDYERPHADAHNRKDHAEVKYDDPLPSTPLLPSTTANNAFGGRLEELFLSSSHAKMYVAINKVAVAPCIVGKSTMFRRCHLALLTDGQGIDYFSNNICEDHLIGDLLWRSSLPLEHGQKLRNHGLVLGDLAIQPIAGMSVAAYIARRVRWLRVRKFTVPVATLVEPGTESFLCSFMGVWGATTLNATRSAFGVTWSAVLGWWFLSIVTWAAVDWTVYLLLHSGRTIEMDGEGDIPPFATPLKTLSRRPFLVWLRAWLGREALALPIWLWAIWGGASVTWRDRTFWVGFDMRVHEIKNKDGGSAVASGVEAGDSRANGHVYTKKRRADGV